MDLSNIDEKNMDILITGSNHISIKFEKNRQQEKLLKEKIEQSLKNDGNVILTCDSNSRMYELLFKILNLWPDDSIPYRGPVYLYHNFRGFYRLAHS